MAAPPNLTTLTGRGVVGMLDAMARKDAASLRSAYAELLSQGSLWSSTGRCKGFAVANPGEDAAIDTYLAQLAAEFEGSLPPPVGDVLWEDTFDGPAGYPPKSSFWRVFDGQNIWEAAAPRASNAFLNGQGQLVLRSKREPGGWMGKQFSSGAVATYDYDSGWPSKGLVRKAFAPPFQVNVRFRWPDVNGHWNSNGWWQTLDFSAAQGIYEIDSGEWRSGDPTQFGAHHHKWVNGTDAGVIAQTIPGTTGRGAWHEITTKFYVDRTEHVLDGVAMKSGYGIPGRMGLLMHNGVANTTAWGSEYGKWQPNPDDPGPWDALIDHVRVSSLP